MGNCQAAAEAAAVVIQHPGGKVERLYGPATAADVMRRNPGHYVALVVLRLSGGAVARPDPAVAGGGGGGGGAKITKVKLLKPNDALLLGHVYRLITSQEVTKALQARRQEKMRRCDEVIEQPPPPPQHRWRQPPRSDAAAASEEQRQPLTDHQERKRPEKGPHRSSAGGGGGSGRGRYWRPSLQSISESAS